MMVLYGYWTQWYGTVRCYTAGGRTIISYAANPKGAPVSCPTFGNPGGQDV
jgi:hypothetical protein